MITHNRWRIAGQAHRLPRLIGRRATGAVALQFVLVGLCFAAVPITCWDAASQFNDCANPDAGNPSGVWSYGWKTTLTDRFFLMTTPYDDPPSRFGWCNSSGLPEVSHSVRPIPAVMNGPNSVLSPPRSLFLHPGINGEYAVIRFTSPSDGTYRVSGQFYALDDNGRGTTTDVWVMANNNKTGAFSGKVEYRAGPGWASFTSREFQLKKGEPLDFQVGCGANKSCEFDSTGLNALIEKIK